MTMRIGHTLFGGAVAGLVIASGVAVCMSSANAKYKVTRHFESSTEASATSTGYGIKELFNTAQTVNCTATAQGACVVEFKPLPVEITATAVASGKSKAEYFTYAFANGDALTVAKAVRTSRLYPYHAKAYSYAEGDGQSWQMGYAKTAYASAIGFGTTYHVGSSNAVAKATITSRPSIDVGTYSDSLAIAEAVVTGQFTIGGAGLATAVANACVDSAVTVNNIRIFTANGTGECVVTAVAQTIGVHQSQTGYCSANISATPKFQIGGKGTGIAVANGVGDSIGISTAAAAIDGDTSAFAVGTPLYNANAYSQCMASAFSIGIGKLIQTRVESKFGEALAEGTGYGSTTKLGSGDAYSNSLVIGNGKLIQTRVESKFSKATAIITGKCTRIKTGRGIAHANCQIIGEGKISQTRVESKFSKAIAESTSYGSIIKIYSGDAYSNCLLTAAATKTIITSSIDTTAIATAKVNTTVIGVVPKPAVAVSTLNNKVKRTVSAKSTTVAEATAMGYLQVNDLQEAPEERTYILEQSVRLTIVSEEPRLVVV